MKEMILDLLKQPFGDGNFEADDLDSFGVDIGKMSRELYVDL
jgi:hypothetical protein